jgi:multidrug efflux system outer membrane protein
MRPGSGLRQPTVEVPPSYRFSELSVETAQPAWWNAYHDHYLDDLVREALASNRDLRIATARVDEFAAILAGTQSQAYPQGRLRGQRRPVASERADHSRLCRSEKHDL